MRFVLFQLKTWENHFSTLTLIQWLQTSVTAQVFQPQDQQLRHQNTSYQSTLFHMDGVLFRFMSSLYNSHNLKTDQRWSIIKVIQLRSSWISQISLLVYSMCDNLFWCIRPEFQVHGAEEGTFFQSSVYYWHRPKWHWHGTIYKQLHRGCKSISTQYDGRTQSSCKGNNKISTYSRPKNGLSSEIDNIMKCFGV